MLRNLVKIKSKYANTNNVKMKFLLQKINHD